MSQPDNTSINIADLRQLEPVMVSIGNHAGIIQSILDYDFLIGRARPSVAAIIATGRTIERFFFGPREVVIPVYTRVAAVPDSLKPMVNLLLNVASGRRVLANNLEAMDAFPNLIGGNVFAEGVPERQAVTLANHLAQAGCWCAGPASVGMIIPDSFKLGAIGGIEAEQFQLSRLIEPGSVAVISSSGGMVNEIIRSVASSGHGISFAVALGGERYPLLTPAEAFLAAEADEQTAAIAYFGELGGEDEYALAELLQSGRITKPVLTYIAGSVAELFASPPQFGHAKAMASSHNESAEAKTEALQAAGAQAAVNYADFMTNIANLPKDFDTEPEIINLPRPATGLFISGISHDDADGDVRVLGHDPLQLANQNSFAKIVISMILGRLTHSDELEQFVDMTLKLLVDHGPYVSGSINTIVTARAGRDLVSALSAGLLTVGPRFGGAINHAAAIWLDGVSSGVEAAQLVEDVAARKQYISGIGHRKYRTDKPDPRVTQLLQFSLSLPMHPYTDFAMAVAAETSAKKANLILNVDGAIAGVLLDLLHEAEGLSTDELQQLVDIEAFNALFVLSRSVGFMAHYFDQRRHDEGLFRLLPEHVTPIDRD